MTQTPFERVLSVVGALAIPILLAMVGGFAIEEDAHPWVLGGIAAVAAVVVLLTPYLAFRAARCEIVASDGVLTVRGWIKTVEVPARDVVRFAMDTDVDFPVLVTSTAGRRRRHVLMLLSMSHRTLPHLRAKQMHRRTQLRNWIRQHGGLSARSRRDG